MGRGRAGPWDRGARNPRKGSRPSACRVPCRGAPSTRPQGGRRRRGTAGPAIRRGCFRPYGRVSPPSGARAVLCRTRDRAARPRVRREGAVREATAGASRRPPRGSRMSRRGVHACHLGAHRSRPARPRCGRAGVVPGRRRIRRCIPTGASIRRVDRFGRLPARSMMIGWRDRTVFDAVFNGHDGFKDTGHRVPPCEKGDAPCISRPLSATPKPSPGSRPSRRGLLSGSRTWRISRPCP